MTEDGQSIIRHSPSQSPPSTRTPQSGCLFYGHTQEVAIVVHSRPNNPLVKSQKMTRHRANPQGLGRLIIMTATVGLMTLGQGLWWWFGLFLLALILLAIGRRGKALWGIWSLITIVVALGFWHLGIIPQWAGLTFVSLAGIQFALSLLTATTP